MSLAAFRDSQWHIGGTMSRYYTQKHTQTQAKLRMQRFSILCFSFWRTIGNDDPENDACQEMTGVYLGGLPSHFSYV